MGCSFQVIVSLIEVFLLDLDLGNLIQGRAAEMVVVIRPDDLLKVQDGVTQIVQLLQCLGLVEVGLAEGLGRLVVFLSNLCELGEVLQRLV